ncbi:hypothetical protein D3C71_1632160 [compost metagenome]
MEHIHRGHGSRRREVRIVAARRGPLVTRALHDRVGDRSDHRHLRHLRPALHRREGCLHAGLHGLSHDLLDLGVSQPLLHVELAGLQLVPGQLDLLRHTLLDLAFDVFR